MFFIFCVLGAALLIEGIGTYVSVVGLSALFSANAIIIALAVALDAGKLVSVSFLYHNWARLNVVMRAYMLVACAILMTITSAGAFGFLSTQFQRAMSNTNQHGVMLTALTDEQERLSARKREIDSQIAALPAAVVRGRTQLMKQFAPEVERINSRLVEIDHELPRLKVESIKKNVEVGPIMYVAEVFDVTPERAAKWIIFTIIFVFDPLAIVLLLSANFLIEERARALKEQKKEKDEDRSRPTSAVLDGQSLSSHTADTTTGAAPTTPSREPAPLPSVTPTVTQDNRPALSQSAAVGSEHGSGTVHGRPGPTSDLTAQSHPQPQSMGADSGRSLDLPVQSSPADTIQHTSLAGSALAQQVANEGSLGLIPAVRSSLEDVSSFADVDIQNNETPANAGLHRLYRSA